MTDECKRNIILKKEISGTARKLALIRQEIEQLRIAAKFPFFPFATKFSISSFSYDVAAGTCSYLDSLSRTLSGIMSGFTQMRDSKYEKMVRKLGDDGAYRFRQEHYNENLADLVLNKSFENKILVTETKLIRKKDPVFMEPESKNGRAHFYAPEKNLFICKIDTFWFNFCVLWLMSLVLYLTLLTDLLRKILTYFETIRFKKRLSLK